MSCNRLSSLGSLRGVLMLLCVSTVLGTLPVAVRIGNTQSGPATPMCTPVACSSPARLACRKADGCPNGCGVECVSPEVSIPPSTSAEVVLPQVDLKGREVVVPIPELPSVLARGESLDAELLTVGRKNYDQELTLFYGLVDKLCHVATVSKDVAITQRCSPGNRDNLLKRWKAAVSYLSDRARGVLPSPQATAAFDQFVRSNSERIYLVVQGRSLVPVSPNDLVGIVSGKAATGEPLSMAFEGCPIPLAATGASLSKVCRVALPVPPIIVRMNKDRLALRRQTGRDATVIVGIQVRSAIKGNKRSVALLPVRVLPISEPRIAAANGVKGSSTMEKSAIKERPAVSSVRSSSSSQSSVSSRSSGATSSASSGRSSSYTSSHSSSSSSSVSNKYWACVCDGFDGAGRPTRGVNSADTKSQCEKLCPPSKRDRYGWCRRSDAFGTVSKIKNCTWEQKDSPLN